MLFSSEILKDKGLKSRMYRRARQTSRGKWNTVTEPAGPMKPVPSLVKQQYPLVAARDSATKASESGVNFADPVMHSEHTTSSTTHFIQIKSSQKSGVPFET